MVHPHNHFAFVAIKKKLYIKSHFSVLAIFNKSHVNTIKNHHVELLIRVLQENMPLLGHALDSVLVIVLNICDRFEQKQADEWVQSPAEVCNLPHQCLTRLHTSARDCTHPSVCFCSKRSHIFIWL